MEVIVQNTLCTVRGGDQLSSGDVDGADPPRRDLPQKFLGIVAMIQTIGEDVVEIQEQIAI